MKELKDLKGLVSRLEAERNSFDGHWGELASNMAPRRIRLNNADPNKGDKRNQSIKDETPLIAVNTLKSGMMGGVTSPAREWFKLGLQTPTSNLSKESKEWLEIVTKRMQLIFSRSNLYRALPTLYGDIGVFGTGVIGVEEDFSGEVVRFITFPVGSYCLATNHKRKVNTFTRAFKLTPYQVVSQFGRINEKGEAVGDNISDKTKEAFKASGKTVYIECAHVVQPNHKWNPDDPTSFRYNSIYFEMGEERKFLRKGGFQYFPVLATRWETTGEDVYGTNCPGMQALPAIKELHLMELKSIQAIEKMINPPMKAPISMKTQVASVLPGDVNYVDNIGGDFAPLYQVKFPIAEHEAKQQSVRGRIFEVFYYNLFLIFSEGIGNRDRVTATEIQARKDEKLQVLGPTLEALNEDLLEPLINVTYSIMAGQGLLPPAPPEMQNQPLKVNYVSILHQAQQLLNLSGHDRFLAYLQNVGQISQELMDSVDFDRMTKDYADILGIPPHLLRSDNEVKKIRESRAQAQQAQTQNAEATAATETAAKVAQAVK